MSLIHDTARILSVHPREREHQAANRAYLFGSFNLLRKAQPIEQGVWRRQKAKQLLKWFLLTPLRPYAADQLIDLFWCDSAPEVGLRNLYVTIHHLRRLLEPDLLPHQESRYLRRDKNNFYWLEVDESWWTDVHEVQQIYEHAHLLDQQQRFECALFYYRKIVSYCNKGFLPEDQDNPAFNHHRQRYDSMYLQVLERLIRICTDRGEYNEALEYSYAALLLEPYSETAIRAIVNVYSQQSKDSSLALQKLLDFRTFLHKELGVDTNEEWLQRILRPDPRVQLKTALVDRHETMSNLMAVSHSSH